MNAQTTWKTRVTRSTLCTWTGDEYASWEDDGCPNSGHVYNILNRHVSVLEIRDMDEAKLVIQSGRYFGDPSAWSEMAAYHAAVGRVTAKVIEAFQLPKRKLLIPAC